MEILGTKNVVKRNTVDCVVVKCIRDEQINEL